MFVLEEYFPFLFSLLLCFFIRYFRKFGVLMNVVM